MSLTTDFCVEAGLGKNGFLVIDMCPHVVRLTFLAERDADDDDDAHHNESCYVDIKSTSHVPGSLHIVHNVCKDVTDSILGFVYIEPGLTALAILSSKHYREAFFLSTATCFSVGESTNYA